MDMTLETRWSPEIRFDEETRQVSGTIMTYGDMADIGGEFREQFVPGAFQHDDVILNLMHDRMKPLARTVPEARQTLPSGSLRILPIFKKAASIAGATGLTAIGAGILSTVVANKIAEAEKKAEEELQKKLDQSLGLRMEAKITQTSDGDTAMRMIKDGILQGLSVEFRAIVEDWQDGGRLRIVKRALLSGVALVDRPAYPRSSIDRRRAILARSKRLPGNLDYYV